MLFTTCRYITANMLLKHFDSLLLMTYKTINRETVQCPLLYLFARMGQIWTFIIKFVLPILRCDFRGLYRSPRSQVVYRCNNNFQTFYGVLYGLTCYKSLCTFCYHCYYVIKSSNVLGTRTQKSLLPIVFLSP